MCKAGVKFLEIWYLRKISGQTYQEVHQILKGEIKLIIIIIIIILTSSSKWSSSGTSSSSKNAAAGA